MNLLSLAAIYFVVWWLVLFTILPWGIRTQAEDNDIVLGTSHSAPTRPMLLRKVLATTVVSAILVFAFWVAVDQYGFDLETIADFYFGSETGE